MRKIRPALFLFAIVFVVAHCVSAQDSIKPDKKNPAFDAELAKKLGADKMGMKNYVLVILKTGPTTVPAGKERDEIFKGHFANIHRLADEGKLAVAGPFGDNNDWQGMFIFNVESIEDGKKLTETDPVIKSGLMIPEFHKLYCSAALMEVNKIHQKVAETNF